MKENNEISGATYEMLHSILETPRYVKRLLLGLADFVLISFSLWIVLSLRYGFLYWPHTLFEVGIFLLAPTLTIIIFVLLNLYRLVTRFLGFRGFGKVFLGMSLAVVLWSMFLFLLGQTAIPHSVIMPYAILATLFVIFIRLLSGSLLRLLGIDLPQKNFHNQPRPVLIYGAGQMGVRLLQEILRAGDRNVVAFIDKSKSLHGQVIMGTQVHAPQHIKKILARHQIKEVILALPPSRYKERSMILRELEGSHVEVLVLPSHYDISMGPINLKDLRKIDVVDLLSRDCVEPQIELLSRSLLKKSILVTGAGGSIGSELVRQILRQNPARLVLLDISEYALYQIEMDVHESMEQWPSKKPRPEVHGILGSVLDSKLVSEVITTHSIQTIYHAAAYKHVPIVEANVVSGLKNNIFGMKVIADAALKHKVELVVLVSTDKAVRPTNVMGASKRVAELILQAYSAENCFTKFSIVRFGNVLDSSGSVVSRFRRQISLGGPVTVTHKKINRYFMSIPEAASLVIQSGAMAEGGDVFLLDMGEPLRIDDLARQMIRLAGLEVRDDTHPDGDIEIIYTGLRPGEKLYEELLITPHAVGTEHPCILRSQEPFLRKKELERELDVLKSALESRDKYSIKITLKRMVEDYFPAPVSWLTNVPQPNVDASKTVH